MTWLGWSFLAVMLWPALYITWNLHRMRKAAQAKVREINRKLDATDILLTGAAAREALAAKHEASAAAHETEALYLYEKAREVYADANARWSSLVRTEGRIH